MSAPTVAEALDRPHNAFSMLRLALALAVVVSHAASVASGNPAEEPLMRATGFALGEHAVNGFFAVSGFLVTMSLDRRGARDYVIARSLRILPGLLAATFAVSLGLGAALTRLPVAEYYASSGLWRFVADTLTTFKSNASLPGVFEANPYRSPLGTVWTLKYESLCYLGVLVAGITGALRRRVVALALVGGLALGLLAADILIADLPKGVETALRLPMIFAGGAALYLWRDRVRLSAWLLLGLAAAFALKGTPLYRTALFLAECYGAIWFAFASVLARPSLDLPADLSYGVYLYGWPIQQTLHALVPQLSAWGMLALSIPLSLGVAALSWYAIEKPALTLKARALGRGTIEPAGP